MKISSPTVDQLFQLVVNASDRQQVLNAYCTSSDLRQEVEKLLAEYDAAGTLASDSYAEVTSNNETNSKDSSTAGTAGSVLAQKYTLLKRIGQGGMGEVWRGEQLHPIKREVAIKLIKRGYDSEGMLLRFEAERQALAWMDHPNIARIYDAGMDQGMPYFVMELVAGKPLTQFCDEQQLSLHQRLELFIPICRAVQHAHQKGIIHRDLKPGNVLVTLVDQVPVPKVIDFGVAKATEQKLTEQTLNETGAIVGTPQYMSPEQADPDCHDIDTRTDIYALGVMLYELLAGSPPLDARAFKGGAFLEMFRLLREIDPPRPSTRVNTDKDLPAIASKRSTQPDELKQSLQGDLDWIVMKALEKDRSRRYATANDFAQDIQCYLQHMPVQAAPPSKIYRLKKFVRRYRYQVIAASLVLLALLAGIVGTTWQAHEATLARNAESLRAEGERKAKLDAQEQQRLAQVAQRKAVQETQKAHALNHFLQHRLLDQADVQQQANALLRQGRTALHAKRNPTVRELLDRAATELTPEKINLVFPDQPLLQAEILDTMGRTYRGIGEYATSIQFLERAYALQQKHLSVDDTESYTSCHQLAITYHLAGRMKDALQLLETNSASIQTKLGEESRDANVFMCNLARIYQAMGQYQRSINLFEQALKQRYKQVDDKHQDILTIKSGLGGALLDAGLFDQAIRQLESVLRQSETLLGDQHPDTMNTCNTLGVAYYEVQRFPESATLLERVHKVDLQYLGPDHAHTLNTQNNLARTYHALGRMNEALPLFEQTVATFIEKYGKDNPDTLQCQYNQARVWQDIGKTAQARKQFDEVYRTREKVLGSDHPDTIHALASVAACNWKLKKLDESVPQFEKALKQYEKILGRQHLHTLRAIANLGVNLRDAGKPRDAIPFLKEAAEAAAQQPALRWVANELLIAYAQAGDKVQAAAMMKDQMRNLRKELPKESVPLAGMLASAGLQLLLLEQYTDAEAALSECLTLREKLQPQEWTTFNTKSTLGGVRMALKRYAEAEPLLLQGYQGMKEREKKIPAEARIRLPEAVDRLIAFYTQQQKPEEVKRWQTERALYPQPADGKK